MNGNDLYDWKRHPVTVAIFSMLKDRIKTMSEYLIENVGVDPLQDQRFSGAIKAHRDLLEVAFEDISEETE